jgi:Flp pilus assembly protein TadD
MTEAAGTGTGARGPGPDSAGQWQTLATLTAAPGANAPETVASAAERCLTSDPGDPIALMAMAGLASGRGDDGSAIEIYQAILARYPKFTPAQRDLAVLYTKHRSDLVAAASLAASARETLPRDPLVARTLGLVRYLSDQPETAIPLLEEAARSSPLDPEASFALGMALVRSGQPESGTPHLRHALDSGLPEPMASEAEVTLADIAPASGE